MRNILAALIIAIATPAIANTKPIELDRTEVIVIRDTVAQPAKAQRDPRVLPPYSDKAIESNEWTRAWLLLDIDRTGSVRRVKFVHKPGLDLETIALQHAFTTHFEPAIDRSGAPVSSQLVWGLEWPAHSWLQTHTGSTARLPHDMPLPICRGDGPLNLGTMLGAVYRDCTAADLAHPETWGAWLLQPRS
jgi:hypothetical protein